VFIDGPNHHIVFNVNTTGMTHIKIDLGFCTWRQVEVRQAAHKLEDGKIGYEGYAAEVVLKLIVVMSL
jgi:hypothetical protein